MRGDACLDVLIDHGDPILNMVLHRAQTHALFWLSLFSLPFAWAVARLHGQGIAAERVLVTPSALNTVLWRVVAVGGGSCHEGFYSFFDADRRIDFRRVDQGDALLADVQHIEGVQRIRNFSQGFYALQDDDGLVRITDLRMGQYPGFAFAFHVAKRRSPPVALVPSLAVGGRPDPSTTLPWLWCRMWGERIPSPS